MDDAWVPFEAIVATSHRVEKYGGIALADSALMQMVDALNSGKLPMIGHHDRTKPIRTKDLEASLVTLSDGERAVRLTGLVVQEDWEAVGHIGGMSFSTSVSLGRADGPNPDAPALTMSADAGWFDDETIGKACSLMCALAPVEGKRLLQFTAVDDARVILEMGYNFVLMLGPNLATSAIYDGIKHLLTHRKKRDAQVETSRTRFEFVTPLPTGEVIGILDTSDSAVAAQALATYSEAVSKAAEAAAQPRRVVIWREDGPGSQWTLPG